MGGGVVTPGLKSADRLALEVDALNLPDLTGRSVLDIGAWDGYFSFEVERRGASRVVALDHYAWSVDQALQRRRTQEREARGERVPPWHDDPELWQPDQLPGRAAFDLARRRLGSRVEPVVGDFMTMDLASLATFDVVLFLGVLYHLQDPFVAMRRLLEVTRGVAILETVCVVVPGREDHQLWELFEGDELDSDPNNWWAANAAGLAGMCRAAGFTTVELKGHPASDDPPNPGYDLHYGRAVLHAHR
ncbi:MAG: class I SAM-dependent methyltransferase [Acidimicrobiales bacterium]